MDRPSSAPAGSPASARSTSGVIRATVPAARIVKFGVDEAEDGAAALEICRRKMPDAILLDWNMPTMSGVDFLRALRREPSGGKPIVVYCTTENDLTVITEAMGAGANEYIMKPFDRETVIATFTEAGLV